MALLVHVGHDLLQVLGVHRVEHVEEVASGWVLVLGEIVGEVQHEGLVLRQRRPQLLDRQLVVLRHLDGGDGPLLQQLLLLGEDRLEKIFVDLRLRRQVVL